MRIASELIIVSKDVGMPSEDFFMPSLWAAPDFHSDGNFYLIDIADRWTELVLERRPPHGRYAMIRVLTAFEDPRSVVPLWTQETLLPFLHRNEETGRPLHHDELSADEPLQVTSLHFESYNLGDYRLFLENAAAFLERGGGVVANLCGEDAAEFRRLYLGTEGGIDWSNESKASV